ncbi:MAG: hypothetical protein K2Q22_05905, partial [Cytophagales bacterium]|nr:hypothetical protein [Cytophagales bacterium]
VTFSGSSVPYNVGVEYSLNNGNTWVSAIPTGYVANVTNYNWNVPNVNSSNVILRVKDYFGSTSATVGGLVVSTNPNPLPFSITSPIYSGTSLSYTGGSNLNVQWNNTLTQCIPYVKLEVSTNGGSLWYTATTSTPNTGSFSLSLPNVYTNNALVKVSNAFDPTSYDITDVFTIVGSSGSKTFSISNPLGGDVVSSACSTKTITLATSGYQNFSGFYASVDISTNSGINWISVNSSVYFSVSLNNNNTVATGSITVPWVNTSNARIRVKDNSTLFTATTASDFTIQQLPLSISNLFPVGGTVLYYGNTPTFSWTSPNSCIPTVRLEYSNNGGTSWTTIANVANFNSYSSWALPSTIPSGNFWIKVSDASNPQVSVTNSYVVSPRFINITNPTSTTVFAGCTPKTIGWTHGGSSNNYFNIDFTTNSGANWTTISSYNLQSNSPGTYNWNVPNINSSTVQLRISDSYNPSFFATTPSFTVSASPALLSGAYTNTISYTVGNTAYLYWTNSGCTSSATPVDISISRDGGASFTTIVSGVSQAAGVFIEMNAASN